MRKSKRKKKSKISYKPNPLTLTINAKETAKIFNPFYQDIDWTVVVTNPRSVRKLEGEL